MPSQIPNLPDKEITPHETYLNRRTLLRALGLTASLAATGTIYRYLNARPARQPLQPLEKLSTTAPAEAPVLPVEAPAPQAPAVANSGFTTDEPLTPRDDVTSYNNFYEFDTSKDGVADAARGFISRPWTLSVGGLVSTPQTFDLDQLNKLGLEERVYRHRCVEAWSMVIPWLGFPLAALLKKVQPLSSAKYVAFQTLFDPVRMPNQSTTMLAWPYVEGLRMDEAMHPLTILAMGLYGSTLPPQNGAPVRLVCPWKYGFKGCKSIVKITLTEEEPPSTWNIANPREYGFYSNVNPAVPHPRWSQAEERRLPGLGHYRPTLPFNGYGEQVASLYKGMDLVKYY